MEHHGLYTDISNNFPGSGVLPNTNVKYHHLPQIPPQPPPNSGQGGNSAIYLPQQQQSASYGQQQQQQAQAQHVETDPLSGGGSNSLYSDAAGLFDATNALCTNSSGSSYNSSSTSSNNKNVNNSKTIEFTSRKFETNTGDSITYNINNINTNIVNNISGGSLGTNGVQGITSGQAAIASGPASDFLGSTQFANAGGNAQISFNKEGDTNPTIINISNNNHNIMAPPYPYPYQTKISGIGALNELNSKFGVNHGWTTASGTSHSTVGEFGQESSVISSFESKNPNKYHTSRTNYRYQQDYVQQNQQPQPTAQYQHSYGLYHPEGAQATPIQQPSGHHGYEPYIIRSKYPTIEETNRYGRGHQCHSGTHSQSHHDLMYNERSRYTNNFASGYMAPAPGYYPTSQTNKQNLLNPNVEYFSNGYMKQIPPLNPHAANPYLLNRPAYPTQTLHQNYHHNPTFDDPYHHRTRVPTVPHHFNDPHAQQPYANYPNHTTSHAHYPPNAKLTFSKTVNDFYAPNVPPTNPSHHFSNPISNPTAPTIHRTPHYGIQYTSQTIVPPQHHQTKTNLHATPVNHNHHHHHQQQQQLSQKSSGSCYYDTPNPIIDMNQPFVDLEEQINSVKILKTNRESTTYDGTNHALKYDCQQKYLINRYLHSKPSSSRPPAPSGGGYVPNGSVTNLTNYGYTTMEDLGLGHRDFTLDENLKDKNLRDYLSSWNETEEEEAAAAADKKLIHNSQFESCKYLQEALEEHLPPLHSGVIVANVQCGANLPDILVDLEKTAKEEQPQQQPKETPTEVGERLYILETYDVPHSELNKYKHLSVINELPKNVVPINDSADSLKFLEEIESNRDKYYQTELESEVVYEERRKDDEDKVEAKVQSSKKEISEEKIELAVEAPKPVEPVSQCDEETQEEFIQPPVAPEPTREDAEEKKPKVEEKETNDKQVEKQSDQDAFKVPHYIPKYRRRRHYHYDYPRFPKKARRSSIEDFLNCDMPRPKVQIAKKNPKKLLTLCVATLNSREFRRYAKKEIERGKELEARRAAEADEKRSIEAAKRAEEVIAIPEETSMQTEEYTNQKPILDELTIALETDLELPVGEQQEPQIEDESIDDEVFVDADKAEDTAEKDEEETTEIYNPKTLRELAGSAFDSYRLVYDYQRVPSLSSICYQYLLENSLLPQPETLQEICERFICDNRQLFIVEEVVREPETLHNICQKVLSETNIIIDVNDLCIINDEEFLDQEKEEDQGQVYIVDEETESVIDLLDDDDDDEVDDEEVVFISEEVNEKVHEDHEIFREMADIALESDVVMENYSQSDSENEIYRNVELEIERMMTSPGERDDGSRRCPQALPVDELDNEFFAFVEDDCIQYEEVIPVDKVAHRRDSLINTLRDKYVGKKQLLLASRLKLLRKYINYLRFICTKNQRVVSKSRFFSKRLVCLQRKIATLRRKIVTDVDSDSNCSTASSVSNSSSSSSSSSSSAISSDTDGNEIGNRSVECLSEDLSIQSGSSISERLIETNNNQVDASIITKTIKTESQQFAKEEDSNSNSSDSQSRGCLRRPSIIPPQAKKKKPSFEESLLNIEQLYRKSPSPNSPSLSPATKTRRLSINCRPNVIVNVNNNREAPKKLIIPSYKIFDQALNGSVCAKMAPLRTVSRRTLSRSSSSSSSSCSGCVSSTKRSSGLIRVNYAKKPSPSARVGTSSDNNANSRSRARTSPSTGFDRRIPYVRLERIDYVEKLAEKYRNQHQQQQFSKLRQRRKSTCS